MLSVRSRRCDPSVFSQAFLALEPEARHTVWSNFSRRYDTTAFAAKLKLEAQWLLEVSRLLSRADWITSADQQSNPCTR